MHFIHFLTIVRALVIDTSIKDLRHFSKYYKIRYNLHLRGVRKEEEVEGNTKRLRRMEWNRI